MKKNVSGQKWLVFAFNRTTNAPVTGDAANITAKIRKDYGASTSTNDSNPTELENGFYQFDLEQAETNADVLSLIPSSTTSNVQVIGSPPTIATLQPTSSSLVTTAGFDPVGDTEVIVSLFDDGAPADHTVVSLEPGDVTISSAAGFVQTANDPTWYENSNQARVVITEDEKADLSSFIVRFQDQTSPAEFDLVEVPISLSSSSVNVNVTSINGMAVDGGEISTNVIGPLLSNGALQLMRNKDYLAANVATFEIPLPGYSAKLTDADSVLLTIRNRNTKTKVIDRHPATSFSSVDEKATYAIDGSQLNYPFGALYEYLVEIRHGTDYQPCRTGCHALLDDIAE